MTKLKPITALPDNAHTRANQAAANKVLARLTALITTPPVTPSIDEVTATISTRIEKLKEVWCE